MGYTLQEDAPHLPWRTCLWLDTSTNIKTTMPYILGAFPAENQASMKPYCFFCKSCSADARMHTSVQADPTRGNCQNCQHILLRCYWQSNNIIKDLSLSCQFCYCSSIFNQSFVLVRQLSFVLYFLIHIDLLRAEISRRSLLWIL